MNKSAWMVIVNPKAGRGRGLNDWPMISNLLNQAGVEFSCVFSVHKYHAIELTYKAIKDGYRKIAALGGDGTLHEVVNAIFMQNIVDVDQIVFGLFPLGSGNDWARSVGIPVTFQEMVNVIADGYTRFVDVGRIKYQEAGVHHTRYMVNALGVGMDAKVIEVFDRAKERKKRVKRSLYVNSLVKGFFSYRFLPVEVKVDGQVLYSGSAFSVCAGKGRYKGNGIMMLPKASLQDGFIDVSVFEKMPKFKALYYLKKLGSGTLSSKPFCHYVKCKLLEVNALVQDTNSVHVEVDGELLGCPPYSLEVMPEALRLVCRKPILDPRQ